LLKPDYHKIIMSSSQLKEKRPHISGLMQLIFFFP